MIWNTSYSVDCAGPGCILCDLHGHANVDLVRRESGLWGYLLDSREEPEGQYPSSDEALRAALLEPRLDRFKPEQVRVRRVTDRR